jgi:hypothetical protein
MLVYHWYSLQQSSKHVFTISLLGELQMEKLHVTVQKEVDSVTSVVGQV